MNVSVLFKLSLPGVGGDMDPTGSLYRWVQKLQGTHDVEG